MSVSRSAGPRGGRSAPPGGPGSWMGLWAHPPPPPPASIQDPQSPLWETYSCPAGSVLFFTEAITHTGAAWTHRERERVAIFNCYNTVGSKWHKWEPHPAQLRMMPPKRQTLFRPV